MDGKLKYEKGAVNTVHEGVQGHTEEGKSSVYSDAIQSTQCQVGGSCKKIVVSRVCRFLKTGFLDKCVKFENRFLKFKKNRF